MTHQMLIPEQLEFIKELDAVQVEVMVDKGRLTQVITNFLNNASKFTKPDISSWDTVIFLNRTEWLSTWKIPEEALNSRNRK